MSTDLPARPRHRPLALIALAFTGVLMGAGLGAGSNAVNGWLSPEYFVNILHWSDVEDVWLASIAQGILEGVVFGLFLSLIFTAVVGVVSNARCGYFLGLVYLLLVGFGAALCWAIGGAVAIGLASLSPEFFRHTFHGVPEDPEEMLRYAWVGGSIWGLEFGGLALTVLASVLFHARWRSRQETST